MRTRALRGICGAAGLIALLLAPAAAAGAVEARPFGIEKFTMQTTEPTEEAYFGGDSYEFVNKPYAFTQAGGHPWALTTTIEFASEEYEVQNGSITDHIVVPTRDPKDVVVDLPPGLLGNPTALPRCPLAPTINLGVRCPADTQVGVFRIHWLGGKQQLNPIVNAVPELGQSAEFVFENTAGFVPVATAHLVRTAHGYGVSVTSNQIPMVALSSVEVTFWGVPGDQSHDAMRGRFCSKTRVNDLHLSCEGGNQPAGVPAVPFLDMPTDCSAGPETATMRADSWQEPGQVGIGGQYQGFAEATATLPAVTGCGRMAFNPSLGVEPDTLLADTPVGLGVNLEIPQREKPESPATPHLRNAALTLPEGTSISPGIADGIQACNESGPEGINFSGPESEETGPSGELQLAPGHCPDASIVGTAEAVTPLLPEPVKGHIYLARPGCGGLGQSPCTEEDALDGNLYRLYLELGGAGKLASSGINVKFEGKELANPATGQLTTKFEDNPELPFSELRVHLNGGPRAPLDNPAACGPAITTSDFTPWSAPGITPEGLTVAGTPDATPSSFFEVGGCASPPGLAPGFQAGVVNPQAGQHSAFTLSFSRRDREQYLSGVHVHTPPGLLGKLAGIPLCEEPQAAQGACSEASKVGVVRAATGAGSHPFEIEGKAYLSGPYKGAPVSMVFAVPVVTGPFNLGTVVTRARIDVDPETSRLTVTSDPLPQIIFGVPLRLQRVTVDIDRPDFIINPTNCQAMSIGGQIVGDQGAMATVSSPFAVAGCAALGFKPKLAFRLKGGTKRGDFPALTATLHARTGDANIAAAAVTLPHSEFLEQGHIRTVCTRVQFAADQCPSGSIYGYARAVTPLLDKPLEGPVYLRSSSHNLPDLVADLNGQIHVVLDGRIDSVNGGIRNSFEVVPDAPVTTFTLALKGGKRGLLVNSTDLCKASNRADAVFTGQNGKSEETHPVLQNSCGRKGGGRKRKAPR